MVLNGCASTTTVSRQSDLFTDEPDRKGCYSYDTSARAMARTAPTSVGLGIVGGLFPPLMIATALASGAAAAADQAALPAKCGITFADAMKEAWTISYYEKTTAYWIQKRGMGAITASYVSGDEECSTHDIVQTRGKDGAQKAFKQKVKICRNDQGEPELRDQAALH